MGSERNRSVASINTQDDVADSVGEPEESSTVEKNRGESAAKLRKLLPLLPRTPTVPSGKRSGKSTTQLPGPCGIRACRRISCNLESHRRYAKAQANNLLRKNNDSSKSNSNERLDVPSRSGASSPQIQKTIVKAAGFPILPLGQSENSNPALQHFFHDFFVHQLGRLLKLIVTPFNGYEPWAKKRHDHLFEMGVSTQLDCLNFVGAAYIHTLGRSTSQIENKETGIMVHSNILNGLRSTLGSFDPVRDTDRILSIMYTLVMFGLFTHTDKSVSSLLNHRKAMTRVIDSCGGLHNCGPNLPLAISLDRLIATVTETEPVYASWDHVKLPMQRAPKYAAVYGAYLNVAGHDLDEDVVACCIETCRAIEILEGEHWEFDTKPKDPSGETYYLYYLRERISYQFVYLNARYAQENTRSRCVLIATYLVKYIVLWDNYNTMLPLTMADRLLDLLTQQDLLTIWKEHEDCLIWILFTLLCMQSQWKGRRKVVDLCGGGPSIFSSRKRPKDWIERLRLLLTRFVWSWTRLEEAFNAACTELSA